MNATVRLPMTLIRAHRAIPGLIVALVAGCAADAAPSDSDTSTEPNAPIATEAAPLASPSAISLADAGDEELTAGSYVADAPFDVPLIVTVPAGWRSNGLNFGSISLVKRQDADRNAAFADFFLVDGVYADPCRGGTPDRSAVADAESLVEALRAQPGFDIGELSEGTLGGYAAWTWEVVPTVDVATCVDDPWLYQVQIPTGDGEPFDAGTVAGSVQRFTVIDVDGTPLVAHVQTFPSTEEDDLREAEAIIESVTFVGP